MGYKEDNWGDPVHLRVQLRDVVRSAMLWAREAEESPLLEAVARKQPVKTQQAGKKLSGGAVIACSSKSCVKVVSESSHQSEPRL
jgi:hypothetical protein